MTAAATLTATHFRAELRDRVAVLTLDRPDRINALTFDVYRELRDLFLSLVDDGHPEVRAVVLQGEGPRGFCSGGDVEDIIGRLFDRDMAGLLEFTRLTGSLIHALRMARPPVVGALHGVVAGAGAVIAAACDVRFAAPDARFAYLFPRVGLCGADMGAAWLLPRLVGLGRATELLLTGDFVGAERAEAIGLVNRVVEADALRDEAFSFAKRLADGPAFAHAMTKRMLEQEATLDLRAAIETEAQAQAICMQHPDFREAFEAWRDKRPARFR